MLVAAFECSPPAAPFLDQLSEQVHMPASVMCRLAFAACIAVAVSNCGSTSTGPSSPTSTCNVILSGAESGAYACVAEGIWSSSTTWTEFALTISSGNPVIVHGAISFPGDLHVGSFSSSDSTVNGGLSVQQAGGVFLWGALTGVTAQGSFALTIASTGAADTASNGDRAYLAMHGELTATAPAFVGTGASGTITIHATF